MRLARVSKRLRAADEPTLPEIARYGSGRILGEEAVQPTNGNVAGVRDSLDGELRISEPRFDIGLDRIDSSSRHPIIGGASICSRGASHVIVAMAGKFGYLFATPARKAESLRYPTNCGRDCSPRHVP